MRRTVTGALAVVLSIGVLVTPTAAHERDVVTPNRLGPIQMYVTTVAEMKDLFGEPRSRTVKQVGCFKVVRLRWDGLQTYHYRQERTMYDVRIRDEQIQALQGAYRFHTRRGLRVGDTEARLRELYPHRKPMTHPNGGHTHYKIAGEANKVLAKVVDGIVTELEAAPYEFC